MADDGNTLDSEERCSAILGIIQKPEEIAHLGPSQNVGQPFFQKVREEVSYRLIEFQDHVANEAVTDHHIDRPKLRVTSHNVSPFDVPDVMEPRAFSQKGVGLSADGISLLFLFSHV